MTLNQENYEAYLLLYIDNELTAPERASVESFLVANPAIEHKLIELQKAVLQPETIPCPGKKFLYRFDELNAQLEPAFKQSLYKKTHSRAKLIGLRKQYIAYASIAAIAIWMVFGVQKFFFDKSNSSLTIKKGDPLSSVPASIILKTSDLQAPIATTKKNTLAKKPDWKLVVLKENNVKEHALMSQLRDIQANRQLTEKNPSNVLQSYSPSTNTIHQNTVSLLSASIDESQTLSSENAAKEMEAKENAFNIVDNPKIEKENFEEIITEDNDRVLYISNIEINEDKLRGIIRKFNALFTRKNNKIE